MTDLPSSIEKIASEITAKHAVEVDGGAFPTNTIDSLRDAGLLGFTTAKEFGGLGQGLRGAAGIVERLARECASSAMVMCMHYSGVAVLEQYGSDEIRRSVANGQHLSTLAFSESGSRSHFWAPLGTDR